MKSQTVNLILRQFSIAAAILLVAGCSFKKDPDKNRSAVIMAQAEISTVSEMTPEEIISQEDRAKALNDLVKFKINEINTIKTSDGSLLDTAIRLDRSEIIAQLLLRGQSPFLLTEVSYRILSYSPNLRKILLEAQLDQFHDFLQFYPKKTEVNQQDIGLNNLEKFNNRLKTSYIDSQGCMKFTDFLMNLKYYSQKKDFLGSYYEPINAIDLDSIIKDLLTRSECASYSKKFSSDTVSNWIADEILLQFHNNFSSRSFLQFLSTISTPNDVQIRLVNSFTENFPRKASVSPIILLILKRPCFETESEYLPWFDLIRRFSNGSYSVPYHDAAELKTLGEECNDLDDCYLSSKNEYSFSFASQMLIFRDGDLDNTKYKKIQKDQICPDIIRNDEAEND